MITTQTAEILNNPKLIECKRKHFEEMQKFYDGKSSRLFKLWGVTSYLLDPNQDIKTWTEQSLNYIAEKAHGLLDEEVFRPVTIEYGIYGVHLLDKILSANVYYKDGQWYNDYLIDKVGTLKEPDLDNDTDWKKCKAAVMEFLNQNVKLPLFGLPTIGSALNIAINLYGERILLELAADSKTAFHDLEIINNTLIKIHKWYIDNLPADYHQPVISWHRTQPYGYGQLCGCSTQLIAPETYRKFVMPLDEKLLSSFPKKQGMIHLCGHHLHQIENFRNMKSLKSVQLNDAAADDLPYYYKGLREDQIIFFNPSPSFSMEKALKTCGKERIIYVSE